MQQVPTGVSPFLVQKLRPTSLWRRFLHKPTPDSAAVALENMVAEGRGGVADLSRTLLPYGLRGERVRSLLRETFAKALTHCLRDDALDDDEHRFLSDLKRRLDLSDTDAATVEATTIHPRYHKLLKDVLADKHISAEEREGLNRLAVRLRLPEDARRRIYTAGAGAVLQGSIEQALSDRRLSAEEERDLKAMAENLGVTPALSGGTLATMERFRLLWRIENGEIPAIPVTGILQDDEVCHFEAPAAWHEPRTSTRRVLGAGSSTSTPIVKGVRFRVGGFVPAIERTNTLTHVDSGHLYLTSKRVLFAGAASNRVVPLDQVVSYQVFSDAIVLEKSSGRSPYLFIPGDIELAAVVLGALLERV